MKSIRSLSMLSMRRTAVLYMNSIVGAASKDLSIEAKQKTAMNVVGTYARNVVLVSVAVVG